MECHCITPILKSTYLFSIFRLTYLETLNEWPWTQYLPFLVKLDIKKYFKTKMWQIILILSFIKFMFSKKATKMDKIFTANLMVATYYQIDSEDFFNFCGLLSKRKLYQNKWKSVLEVPNFHKDFENEIATVST